MLMLSEFIEITLKQANYQAMQTFFQNITWDDIFFNLTVHEKWITFCEIINNAV